MSIPGQIPPQVVSARNAAVLQMLAMRPGATFTAQVVGPGPNGLTQVTVGKETLNLSITPPPAPGTTLQLRLESGGAAPKLVLLSQSPPTSTGGAPSTPVPQPATTNPSSANAPAVAPPTLPSASPAPANTSTPRLAMPAVPVGQSAPPEILAARQGATFTATVTGPAPNGQTQVAIGKSSLNLPITPSLPPGTTVQLRLEGTGTNARLVLATPPPTARPGGEPAMTPQQPATTTPAPPGTPIARAATMATPGAAQSSTTTATPAPATAAPAAPGRAQPPTPSAPTPAQAISQMLPAAATRQDSMAPLLAGLAGAEARLRQMPADVARPATQLLASIVKLDKPLTGETIRQAVARSGIFLEAKLATGAPPPQGDVKAALLQLRTALTRWLGADAIAAPAPLHRPAPPARGAVPRAQRQDLPQAPSPTSARDTARPMLDQADAALHRLRLSQLASLPDESARPTHAAAERNTEIPLQLGHELSMAQFQIFRDGHAMGEAAARGWQMRFTVNFSQIGEVGAHLVLRGRRTGVTLWADRDETAAAMEEMLPDLGEALAAHGLEPGSLRVRRGVPADPERPAGSFVDSLS